MDRVELHDVEYGDCTVLVGQNRQILMVDCGSVSRYARRGEEEIDRRFNEIFSRYGPAAQRQFLLTHYHRDHMSGFLKQVKRDPGYFDRVYLPALPCDKRGVNPVLEFAVFAHFFAVPQSDFAQVNTTCLRIFDALNDSVGADRIFTLGGGDNGLTDLADADFIGDPSQHTGLYGFDEIDALNLLMVPGVTTVPVINAGIAYAEGRKDLLFIADTPMHLEPLEAVDFRKGQGMYSHAAFNSSYAALYFPWLEISDPVNSRKKLVPPCGAVAGCIARSDQKTNVWNAPAGIDRGRIFNTISLAYKTSRGERDVLYPEGINVIAVFPDTGINIWGQKTLQSQPSAVDRINVRRLMMYMEEAISESSRFVVFEPNHPQTWRALGRLINPFLQDIKDKGGLYDFAFQCDEETNTPAVIDRNEMVARVFVKPTKTAEFIELNFILTSTGADFKEII